MTQGIIMLYTMGIVCGPNPFSSTWDSKSIYTHTYIQLRGWPNFAFIENRFINNNLNLHFKRYGLKIYSLYIFYEK